MDNLEQKLAASVNEANAKLNEKMAQMEEAIAKGLKPEDLTGLKESIEASQAELKAASEKQQEQMDNLATEFKKAQTEVAKAAKGVEDPLKTVISANFEEFKSVGDSAKTLRYAVKDMTLGSNLTGDQPRDYNFDVVLRPAQMPNVEDLARTIPISGGTYTFVRSSLGTNNIGTPAEGAAKGKNDYNYSMVDANTDFIAGVSRYSRKMRNNLPFLENALSIDLRRDYYKKENELFEAILAAQSTVSTQTTANNRVEMLVLDISVLAASDFMANAIVISPADYAQILITEKSDGAGYGLPGAVTLINGQLAINGVPIYQASWCPVSRYYVGDWSRVSKIVTEGFSFAVSEEDGDNFSTNNITARVECQCTLVVEQQAALIVGDFSAT